MSETLLEDLEYWTSHVGDDTIIFDTRLAAATSISEAIYARQILYYWSIHKGKSARGIYVFAKRFSKRAGIKESMFRDITDEWVKYGLLTTEVFSNEANKKYYILNEEGITFYLSKVCDVYVNGFNEEDIEFMTKGPKKTIEASTPKKTIEGPKKTIEGPKKTIEGPKKTIEGVLRKLQSFNIYNLIHIKYIKGKHIKKHLKINLWDPDANASSSIPSTESDNIIKVENKNNSAATQKEKKTKRVYEQDSEPYILVLLLHETISDSEKKKFNTCSKRNKNWKEDNFQAQANEARLMMQYDDFTFDELNKVIGFISDTPFWQGNCCNISKLRKQISKLQSQMGLTNVKIPIENEDWCWVMSNAFIQLNDIQNYIYTRADIKKNYEEAVKKMFRFFERKNVLPQEQINLTFECLDNNRPKGGKHEEWILKNTRLWNKWMPEFIR